MNAALLSPYPPADCRFSPDGSLLAAMRGRTVEMYDVSTASRRWQVEVPLSGFRSEFGADSGTVAILDIGSRVVRIDTASGTSRLDRSLAHLQVIGGRSWLSPNAALLAVEGPDVLSVCDLDTGRVKAVLGPLGYWLESASISPSAEYCITSPDLTRAKPRFDDPHVLPVPPVPVVRTPEQREPRLWSLATGDEIRDSFSWDVVVAQHRQSWLERTQDVKKSVRMIRRIPKTLCWHDNGSVGWLIGRDCEVVEIGTSQKTAKITLPSDVGVPTGPLSTAGTRMLMYVRPKQSPSYRGCEVYDINRGERVYRSPRFVDIATAALDPTGQLLAVAGDELQLVELA